jgi:lipid II:glycine glycyltransferase (peptidoglycan interpeptide bridge formation enzyme)
VGTIPFMDVDSFLTGHRGVSLPFTDFCEPIALCKDDFGKLLEEGIEYGRKAGWRFIDIRGGNYFEADTPSSQFYYRHTLELTNTEKDMYSKLRRGTKSCLAKGIREGVTVKVDNSIDGIKEYYKLNCMTRKKHGLPPQPYHFFEKIYEHVISQKQGIVVLASHDRRYIAAAVYFHFGDKAMYKYGASDPAFLDYRPNNVIMWEAIRWYALNGLKSFCFGRTDPTNNGLRQFKTGWGAKEEIVNYYRYDIRNNMFITFPAEEAQWHTKVMKNMPMSLLRIAGTLLYRHMG